MSTERLVPLPAVVGACSSREAAAAAAPLVPGLRPWRIATDDGCDAEGRSIRWELRYDDADHRREVHVVVGATYREDEGTHGEGVASIRTLPFPSQGSELARMARLGDISGRRLRAVWRQQMRERPPLSDDFPDSVALAHLVAPEPVRSAYARVTRQRGPVWVVETPGRTRHLRVDDFA